MPKKLTPRSLSHRHLWFDESDVKLLIVNLQWAFYVTFNRGYQVTASAAEHTLTFYPRRNINPKHAYRCMKYLGIHPEVIKVAIGMIERQKNSPPPKTTHVQFDLWFRKVQRISGKELKAIVAATPEGRAKWNARLKICGVTWDNANLSDDAIARVTQALYGKIFKQSIECGTLKRRYLRWKTGHGRVVSHGEDVVTVPPRILWDPEEPKEVKDRLKDL